MSGRRYPQRGADNQLIQTVNGALAMARPPYLRFDQGIERIAPSGSDTQLPNHARGPVVLTEELKEAGLGKSHRHLHLLSRLDILIEVLILQGEVVEGVGLVLQFELDLLPCGAF
jgi:hypothetical protein